jgi:hypothetical protein
MDNIHLNTKFLYIKVDHDFMVEAGSRLYILALREDMDYDLAKNIPLIVSKSWYLTTPAIYV